VQSLLPESLNIDWSGGKENISLKHLLTMSSGISGADDTDLPISQTPNHSEYFFNLPLAHEPGTKNVYRSASSSTFRDIIAHVTNRPNTLDVYKELLFRPLGISKFEWYGRNSNNHIQSAGHLMLKPRDMMKLGQLYLDKGVWNGKRVVSEAWVKEVITERFDRSKIDAWARNLYHLDGYGYQWWMNDYVVDGQTVKAYQACGQGGQYDPFAKRGDKFYFVV
jgi:CubicO group peptidase (beta-lactamase class C family)